MYLCSCSMSSSLMFSFRIFGMRNSSLKSNHYYYNKYISYYSHCCHRSCDDKLNIATNLQKFPFLFPYSHRVGIVLSFSPVVGIGTPPNPQPYVPPPLLFWGEGHTRWRERGWDSPSAHSTSKEISLF
jgi:hypothetical protein